MGHFGRLASADNGALLCARHHRHVHTHGWTGTLHHGRITWQPPPRHHPDNTDTDTDGTSTGAINGEHAPHPAVQATLDELTHRWLQRNPHLRAA